MRARTRLGLLLLALVVWAPLSSAKIIHREQSLYQTIIVSETGSERCLQFAVKRDQKNQTCLDLRRPKRMVFTYTRMIMAALLVEPNPKRILVVGLGGGTLPVAFYDLLPDATIDVVEIDPAVVAVAERYFDFEANDRIQVHVRDGRVFTKRAAARGDTYDLVILDAFNGDYIPEHMMTLEYLLETKRLLGSKGTLAANTFSISALYHHESETYRAAFDRFFSLEHGYTTNRIIVANPSALPSRSVMETRAREWRNRLKPYEVPIISYPSRMSLERNWDQSKRPLTDQFSPANLLQGR